VITCAWFLTDLNGGGAERIPLVLAPALRKSELSVVLLKDYIQHEIPADGPQIITLSSGGKSLAWAGAPILARSVRTARRFDVLVAGLEWAPTFFTVACGALSRRPVIATVHVNLRRYHEYNPVPAVWWAGMRRALARCAAVVAVSEDVQLSLVDLGVDERRIHIIPNPVSAATAPCRRQSGRPQILTVASLKPMKGIGLALEAAAKLADVDFEWTFVGDGPERDDLCRRAHELGVEDRVRFAGFQPDPDRFYAAADLYVLASYTEGFAVSLVEAMSAGVPAVATRCGRAVEDHVSGAGEIVPVGDAEALAGAIRGLLRDPERRKRLGDAARERARNYEPRIVAEQYDGLFAEVCRQAR
jgi:glycosyltransferase involved in cell wall biosynthesis